MNIIQRRLQGIASQVKTGQLSALASGKLLARQRNCFFGQAQRAFSGGEVTMNKFSTGLSMNPHPAKRDKGGEDAATVSDTFVALADGVGGWAEQGVDPAKYSRKLCSTIKALIMYDNEVQKYMCNPRQLCIEAAEQVNEMGSATCVIASIDREAPVLYTSNLGDSGYLLLRKSGTTLETVFRSKEQTHGFNFPYQIGTGGDDPAKADSGCHTIDHNDILVVGTDGLFDNLYDAQIIDLIWPFVRANDDVADPNKIAEAIANEAERLSRDAHYLSPFAKGAKQQFYDYLGGKQDDITVAVAQVKLAAKENPHVNQAQIKKD